MYSITNTNYDSFTNKLGDENTSNYNHVFLYSQLQSPNIITNSFSTDTQPPSGLNIINTNTLNKHYCGDLINKQRPLNLSHYVIDTDRHMLNPYLA